MEDAHRSNQTPLLNNKHHDYLRRTGDYLPFVSLLMILFPNTSRSWIILCLKWNLIIWIFYWWLDEGNVWTAVAHIITGVIGAGVLSLAWSMAQLGWIAGPLAMVLFASVTLISTYLLCNCYKTPDPEVGPVRNRSYIDAVNMNLGEIFKQFIILF